MGTLYIILSAALAIGCLSIITIILLQKKRQAGFSGNVGGSGSDKTYFSQNKARTREGKLEKWTKILGAFFIILSLVLGFLV